ncbi:MAG: hypothetical protein ACREBN_11940, partial [Burkholderiaceae bacterium]
MNKAPSTFLFWSSEAMGDGRGLDIEMLIEYLRWEGRRNQEWRSPTAILRTRHNGKEDGGRNSHSRL